LYIQALIFHGVDQADVLIHQLCHIFITGDHQYIQLFPGCLLGECADDIIGLYAADA